MIVVSSHWSFFLHLYVSLVADPFTESTSLIVASGTINQSLQLVNWAANSYADYFSFDWSIKIRNTLLKGIFYINFLYSVDIQIL